VESVPEGFQAFNMLSYRGPGKYVTEKARRLLGFEPLERVEKYFSRTPEDAGME
jgi:hypothetical protein